MVWLKMSCLEHNLFNDLFFLYNWLPSHASSLDVSMICFSSTFFQGRRQGGFRRSPATGLLVPRERRTLPIRIPAETSIEPYEIVSSCLHIGDVHPHLNTIRSDQCCLEALLQTWPSRV